MKTIFENNGGAYMQVGDYLLPNLSLSAEEKEMHIGVWANRHRRYLKQHHRIRYYNLLTSEKLYPYLADIEEQAQNLFFSVGKRPCRRRKSCRRTQNNRYDVVGAKDE